MKHIKVLELSEADRLKLEKGYHILGEGVYCYFLRKDKRIPHCR